MTSSVPFARGQMAVLERPLPMDAGQEEATLMGRYCDGDVAAFHGLYASLAPRVLAYLTKTMGDRSLAEDLLQQTFLKVHQSRASYVRGANPAPWIFTIAHRCCLDELRRRKSARVKLTVTGELPPDADSVPGPAEDEPSSPRLVLADLDTLPANQKQALLLTKVEGHSVAQAAAIAGTTAGAIKLRAHRAYVALRARLQGRGGKESS
jgi:RNA polymerase sigma-70 factor, ECF subfamily